MTVRRLCDEVSVVLEARDAFGTHAALDPPPLGARLTSPVAAAMHASRCRESSSGRHVQLGAHGALAATGDVDGRTVSEVCDVEVRFTGPASVVALFRDVLDAFASPGASRRSALERLLVHVISYWESLPRHRDPIFARDGWRCSVPGCSSRRTLQDHHVRYRSRGGNAQANRVAACAAHHLHCIHPGVVRSWGTAPDHICWELGVRSGAPPLLTYVGDRLTGGSPRCNARQALGI